MNYKLSHFGLLTSDMQKNLTVYGQQLNTELTFRADFPGEMDIAFLGKGSDATLELVGQPFLDYEESHIAKHGYSINHLSFQVDDADKAYEELKERGVKVAWKTKDIGFLRQCGFYDSDGLIVEVYSYQGDESLPTPDLSRSVGTTDVILHHVSLVTNDMARSEHFYVNNFGLRRVSQFFNKEGNEESGGFIFLADTFFDGKVHQFQLEIIAGPGLEEREQVLLDKRGPLFDHLCYATADVRGAWQAAIDKGAENFIAPYEEYGVWLAWLRDADGNDIEIMPHYSDEINKAIVRGDDPVVLSI